MSSSSETNGHAYEIAALKLAASGRWPDIVAKLGGVDPAILDGQHHPCPRCGGADRFRAFDDFAQTGGVYCNQCHAEKNGDGFATLQWLLGWDFGKALGEVSQFLGVKSAGSGKSKIVATYDYVDEEGRLLYQVCRLEPGKDGRKKEFRQRRPDGNGGWVWSVKGCRLVPYRLPELLQCGAPLVVEGEKDADRAAKVGIFATCNAMGSGKWRAEYAEHFRGKEVAIVCDNDQPGQEHGQHVARSLFGVARSVKLIDALPGVSGKGDLSDWLDQGHTPMELVALVDGWPEWTPPPAQAASVATSPAAPASALPSLAPGTHVRAGDRGNIGEVVEDCGQTVRVHFVSPQGQHATKDLPRSALMDLDGKRLDGGADEPARQFKIYSMAALDALDLRVDMVIDGMRMLGAPGVDGGSFKTLKTSFALEQGLSMAIGPGAKYLDHFDIRRRAVSVYFAGEGGLVPLRETLRRQCHHKGVRLADVDGFFLCDEVPRLDSDADMGVVVAILQEQKAEFAYFDPCYLMFGAQAAMAGNVYAMGTMLGRMLRACHEAGSTPIILHHFNRAKGAMPNDAPDLGDLSQAGIAEIAGQWALIGRSKSYDPEQPGEHDLVLSVGSRIGFSSKWAVHISEGSLDTSGGRYWHPEVVPYSEARNQERESRAAKKEEQESDKTQRDLDSARRAIVDAATKLDRPATRADIEDRTPIQTKRFCKAWATLVDDGSLVEAGTIRIGNGQVRSAWKLETNTNGL